MTRHYKIFNWAGIIYGPIEQILARDGTSFHPMSKVEHTRYKLMDIRMMDSILGYIQAFRTLMYRVTQMTQHKASSLLMRSLDPKIRDQIGYNVKVALGRQWSWRKKWMRGDCQGKGKEKGQTKQEARSPEHKVRDKTQKISKSRIGERRVLRM